MMILSSFKFFYFISVSDLENMKRNEKREITENVHKHNNKHRKITEYEYKRTQTDSLE